MSHSKSLILIRHDSPIKHSDDWPKSESEMVALRFSGHSVLAEIPREISATSLLGD